MKKTLFLSAVAAMFLFSCKKEHSASTVPSAKRYKVNFSVTNFVQQQSVFALRQHTNNLSTDTLSNLSSYLDVLYYYVFDAGGNLVSKVMQDSTMSNMGTITDSLAAGTYGVYIFAGKKGLAVGGANIIGNAWFGYGGFNWQDTFYDKFTLTVSNKDISQAVTIKRIVGKVELRLLDTIPLAANSISMAIFPEFSELNIVDFEPTSGVSPDTTRAYAIVPSSEKGKTGFTLDKIMGNTEIISTVIITGKDASGKVIAKAIVNNVSINTNTKSVITGKLFTNVPAAQAFQVTADTAWNSSNLQFGFSLRRH
jgi:hypothetical protein